MSINKSSIKPLNINITKIEKSRISEIDFNDIPFGKCFADHMAVVDYADGAWQTPQIIPYQNMSISPACSALHYGQAIFEGMKAQIDANTGEVLFFRPEQNAKRFAESAKRIGMPILPPEDYLQLLYQLVKIDQQWIPKQADASLYLRPYMFANDNYIGVKAAKNYRFIIFTCPVGPYYSQPVKVLAGDQFVRAIPGGTGATKAAGNYGGTIYPALLAQEQGYDQVLWTDGYEFKYAQEIGTMNVFFIIDGTVITPELDGAILEGVTRASVIQLFRDQGVPVQERKIAITQVIQAHQNGTLQDVFGTGTAATISYISDIGFKGKNYTLPSIESRTLSKAVKVEMDKIKRGTIADRHNWMVRI